MDMEQETQRLRARLRAWANVPDWALMVRYELLPQKPPAQLHKRVVQRVGRLLRVMGLDRSRYRHQVWQAGLKHAPPQSGAKPLVFWSEGMVREEARAACMGAKALLQGHPGFVPVLVTDVTDFAFYSRLHWLVEYLPHLGEDAAYYDRKRRYLAWRYRNALALPLRAGLVDQSEFDNLIAGE